MKNWPSVNYKLNLPKIFQIPVSEYKISVNDGYLYPLYLYKLYKNDTERNLTISIFFSISNFISKESVSFMKSFLKIQK